MKFYMLQTDLFRFSISFNNQNYDLLDPHTHTHKKTSARESRQHFIIGMMIEFPQLIPDIISLRTRLPFPGLVSQKAGSCHNKVKYDYTKMSHDHKCILTVT